MVSSAQKGPRLVISGLSVTWFFSPLSKGESYGIIGRNGAGKSTLLKILSRITEPTDGGSKLQGRVASLLEVGTGFHPELTGRENIFLNGAILGMTSARRSSASSTRSSHFAEVEKFIDTPVKRYSSGMYVRLAFAVAAHLEPEILLVDEVLAVGDAAFQKKCLGKMGERRQAGPHGAVREPQHGCHTPPCQRVILLSEGKCVMDGTTSAAIANYYAADGYYSPAQAVFSLQGSRWSATMWRSFVSRPSKILLAIQGQRRVSMTDS